MNRFARTRSEKRASHPTPGRAQWRVGSIDDEGIRYGFTTHALIASTIRIAPAMVTIQSIAIRHGRGRLEVSRSIGFLERRFSGSTAGCGAVATAGAPSTAASYSARRDGSVSVS